MKNKLNKLFTDSLIVLFSLTVVIVPITVIIGCVKLILQMMG